MAPIFQIITAYSVSYICSSSHEALVRSDRAPTVLGKCLYKRWTSNISPSNTQHSLRLLCEPYHLSVKQEKYIPSFSNYFLFPLQRVGVLTTNHQTRGALLLHVWTINVLDSSSANEVF